VRMANIAQTVNVLQSVILTDEDRMLLTPTYHVFEMFKAHQDAVLLPAFVESEDYVFARDTIPAINASASRDGDGRVHMSICNLDHAETKEISCEISGEEFQSAKGRVLTAPSMQDFNSFDAPDRIRPVAFKGFTMSEGVLTISMPPKSVVVLELA
jgi:alpha-L-arabinofuranosidase